MANSAKFWKGKIVDAKDAEPGLADLNSPSKVSIWGLWAWITGQAWNIFEQLIDVKKAELDVIESKSHATSHLWTKAKIEKFQYSATNPQYAQVDANFAVSYPVTDITLRIISRCAVETDNNKVVKIKVATNEPPQPLDAPSAASLAAFVPLIFPAGVAFEVVNKASDKIYIEGSVYYDGQYTGSITDAVLNAIRDYLKQPSSFNGVITVSDIEVVIRKVVGVKDVKLIKVLCRLDNYLLSAAVVVYDLAAGINIRSYQANSGYLVEETTAGNTFTDKITFVTA